MRSTGPRTPTGQNGNYDDNLATKSDEIYMFHENDKANSCWKPEHENTVVVAQ